MKEQLDYIYFFYGLSFLALAAVCYTLRKYENQKLPWLLLELFGVSHGINEWLDMVAISFGDSAVFKSARLVLMTASFVFLFEFGRRSAGKYYKKYADLLCVLLIASGASAYFFYALDVVALGVISRYFLGFSGAVLTALGLWLYASESAAGSGKMRYAAICFSGYAVMSGLIVPASRVGLSKLINQEAFFSFFCVPPQLFRALLALAIANYIFGYLNEIRGGVDSGARAGYYGTGISPALVVIILLTGWIFTDFQGRMAMQKLSNESAASIETITGRIKSKLNETGNIVKILADDLELCGEFNGRAPEKFDETNKILDRYAKVMPDTVCYVLGTSGVAIASSNRFMPDSFAGKDYSFRQYYKDVMAGTSESFFASGVTSKKRGHYISWPVHDKKGSIAGVAVIKNNIDEVERDLINYEYCFLADSHGIVFMAGIDGLQFRALWPLDEKTKKDIAATMQFGDINFTPLFPGRLENGMKVNYKTRNYAIFKKTINKSGWSVLLISPMVIVSVYRMFGVIISFIIFIFIINFFLWLQFIKNASTRIAEEKERLLITLRSIGDGVIVVDGASRVMLMNPAAQKLTGWELSEAYERPLQIVFNIKNFEPGGQFENVAMKAIKTESVVELEADQKLVSKTGGEFLVIATCSPIIAEDNSIIGAVLAFNDITARKKIEEELMKINQLRSLGNLAGGIAHDFNNMLMSITTNLALMRANIRDEEKVNTIISRIEKVSAKAKSLTSQFITFSKGGAPIKKTIDIGRLTRETAELAMSGSKVSADFEMAPDLYNIEADEVQMSQVITNLVINSMQAMAGPECFISFNISNVEIKSFSEVPGVPPGRYVKVSQTDNGSGIAEENLARIFDPYFTTKSKGTGLGLTSVFSIIKGHGGAIRVSSRPGAGTTFELYLPASHTAAAKNEISNETGADSGGKDPEHN